MSENDWIQLIKLSI